MSLTREPVLRGWVRLLAALVLFPLLVAGCALPGGTSGPRASAAEQAAYDAAIAHLPDDPIAAEAALKAYLEDWPESVLAAPAAERLAQIALEAGRSDDAFGWLYYVVESHPRAERAEAVRLRLARWELDRGDVETSQHLAERIDESRLDMRDRRALHRLLIQLSDDPVEQLEHLGRLRAFAVEELADLERGDEPEREDRVRADLERIDREIDALLAGLSEAELGFASSSFSAAPPAARIRLQAALRALERGDPEVAERFLIDAKRHQLDEPEEVRVADLELRLGLREADRDEELPLPTFAEVAARPLPAVEGAVGTIGVVLPLSGRYARFGQEALRGVLLAAGIYDEIVPAEVISAQEAAARQAALTGEAAFQVDALEGEDLADMAAEDRAAGIGLEAAEDAAFEGEADGGGPTAEGDGAAGDPGLAFTLGSADGFELVPGVRILVRDTAGQPELAIRAVRELALREDVVAIVGPIFSAECEAAAAEAQDLGVPLVTLSNREQLPAERDWVFRLRTTPADEVGFLVDYATEHFESANFAVLYPRNRYGRGMRKLYWDAVRERGGRMVAAASYAPDVTDFNEPIRSLIGFSLITEKEKLALREREGVVRRARRLEPQEAAVVRDVVYSLVGPEGELLPPIVDFDALFIPDSHEKIELIAPQLAFHEIGAVRLLGSSDWNHPDLPKVARQHVRGATISTPFFVDSQFGFVRTFVEDYRARFDSEPDTFSSHGYDAASLLLAQMVAGNVTRPDARDGLLRVWGYPGVSGVISMEADGNARKRPFMLGVKRGRIVGLD